MVENEYKSKYRQIENFKWAGDWRLSNVCKKSLPKNWRWIVKNFPYISYFPCICIIWMLNLVEIIFSISLARFFLYSRAVLHSKISSIKHGNGIFSRRRRISQRMKSDFFSFQSENTSWVNNKDVYYTLLKRRLSRANVSWSLIFSVK